MDTLDPLKEAYEATPIPNQLEWVVKEGIKKAHQRRSRKHRAWRLMAASLLFIMVLNANPILSNAFSDVPIIGHFIKVLVFRDFDYQDKTYDAHLSTPLIEGIENTELQAQLNAKYLEENKALYEAFLIEVASLEASGGGHLGIDSGFFVINEDERLFTIGRYYVNTVASSSSTVVYDTVDHVDGIVVTLPSLFKDEGYIKAISDEVKRQMKDRMADDSEQVYWLEDDFSPFESISATQSFYISPERKLVISFDKYEVAPGYMGVVTFEIPYDVLKPYLMGDLYIKP